MPQLQIRNVGTEEVPFTAACFFIGFMAPKLGTLIKVLRPEAVTVEDLNQANLGGRRQHSDCA